MISYLGHDRFHDDGNDDDAEDHDYDGEISSPISVSRNGDLPSEQSELLLDRENLLQELWEALSDVISLGPVS